MRLSLFVGALAHERLLDTDARVANCLASLFNARPLPRRAARLQVGQTESRSARQRFAAASEWRCSGSRRWG